LQNGEIRIRVTNSPKARKPRVKGADIYLEITQKQRDVFVLIAQSIDDGEPISYHEIREKMKYKSLHTVQNHLQRLIDSDLVCKLFGRCRALRLTDFGRKVWDAHMKEKLK
jgi:DNA-binding MarR family transcriptional regulator